GMYAVGYYGYLWAEVLDADAYDAFFETGDIFTPAVATAFRKSILENGGMYDAMQMYKNFRGREADVKPLLRNRGLLD
ncbi:MAG: peptidase M3, partial [Bacteroidales bacterium]|nr:peptidase M3 [Bacteroidales bacterium]